MMCGDGHSAKTFLKKKMESKSKKKLKFLDKEKSEELNENILQAKDRHTEDFKLKFCDTYRTYLEHFPGRKVLFDFATKLTSPHGQSITEHILFWVQHLEHSYSLVMLELPASAYYHL